MAKGEYCDKGDKRKYKLESNVEFLEEEYKKTKGQIILNWHKCLGAVPIPGTSNPQRMKENLAALKFSMNKRHVESLLRFPDKQHRFNDGSKIFGIDIFA